ncbi:hypothetical protein TNCV_1011641 [Trichonephila clavipes]|uniref:Uncharacterized protein n=1 Tax=Trichonephila clavipes TaxID=2585209 RepID=A0A8X6VXC3_TRICX|nr:hypothetical protein TNCV_1011641 [Trichonephila clavipes]
MCNRHMPLNNKCLIRPVALLPPHSCALVISIETGSGFIAEDYTSPVGHSPACTMSVKIQLTFPMIRSMVSLLNGCVTACYSCIVQSSANGFSLIPSDVWKVVYGIKPILVTFLVKTWQLL